MSIGVLSERSEAHMEEKIKFKELSAFIECSTGSTPKVETLKKYIDILSEFGYTQLYLGLTDAYKIEAVPYFNFCRGGYTVEQLQELDAYAKERGIELRANIQVLAHLHYLVRHHAFTGMLDMPDIVMVGEEKVYELIEQMFATMSAGIKSRIIHIGMDEAAWLGAGHYRVVHGVVDKKKLFFEHLERVLEIAKKYGYSCEMWADMFYRMVQGSDFDDEGVMPEDIKEYIPADVRITHWSYGKQSDEVLRKQIRQNKALSKSMTLAGCAWKIGSLAPNNKYSIEVMEHQVKVCLEEQVENYMITMWSDGGGLCSYFAVLPALFVAAELSKGKTVANVDKEKFYRITGAAFDDMMLADYLDNPFFKELNERNNRSYWGLLSDIFLGTHDLMLDEHTNEAYEKLALMYENISVKPFQLMFQDYALYARVLSIKMNLGVRVRNAYRQGDRELLKQYALVDIPKMITYMKAFIDNFEKRWLVENMAFGLEVQHLFYGGQLRRWEYIANRLVQYLDTGEPIEEMERAYLPASLPVTDEDSYWEIDWKKLISNCGI